MRTAASPPGAAGAGSSAHPAYFLDDVLFSGAVSGGLLQVRLSFDGGLVRDAGIMALAVAPLGAAGTFVLARLAGDSCVTRFYRTTLRASGQPGPLTRLGPAVHGEVASLAAAANGQVIGFFVWPCSKTASGYLAVLQVRTGEVRSFGDASVLGSAGNLAVGDSLSLSADGSLAAFTGSLSTAHARTGRGGVWLLRTSAPAGTLAQRSRLVLNAPAGGAAIGAALLSRGGRALYLCTVRSHGTTLRAVVTAHRAADGRLTGTIATLTARGLTAQDNVLGCPMAATPDGRFLLVPYALRYASISATGPLVEAARIGIAAGSLARISFRLPGSGGMSVASGLAVAW